MASDIEEPRYSVTQRYADFEVRSYAPLVVARTQVNGSLKDGLGMGFKRLAGFIFGGNASGMSIAMTAPVSHVEEPDGTFVTFTMPSRFSLDALPAPRDARVQLTRSPAHHVAVRQFSGWVNEGKRQEQEALLRESMAKADCPATGPAVLAQYDPPWKLPFWRRNEIQIPVAPGGC